ncbi:Lipopolysaccharide biosynthesis regulator YciM, contains six TPR domains and a predicted metal-binding C-terminal domain [Alkalimonas amylolytica]|uniref:Lipopolysaccharide biosynthesis regulator YciM, contains six TPR domains and a predicted metal-binding C-terminal domain n=2 Tax=Alkalimonas amylolytica TaxID=152573 RepID=A0A1H4FP81_ALKAM|nr:Lipopolysaccharide biosynthesis regulator YciM, contains six TPR domains and a predicted metal-binding C-terminal domain [Alkalimonas amylolytica]
MLELLFLLLPVAAAYGWFMGRNSVKHQELKDRTNITKNLSSGLNFLLTDQEDKAIEQLLHLLDIEAATIDTYLALANLFRRRGDWDKAIRIHEKLHQLKLPKVQAQQIQYELAKDYQSAGLYDRAEKLLVPLIRQEVLRELALKHLVALYISTHEWGKALQLRDAVEQTSSGSLRLALANIGCEQQQQAEPEQARAVYQQLVASYPKAIRPRFELARVALAQQKPAQAFSLYKAILLEKPQWSADILPLAKQCQLPDEDWYQLLSQLSHKHNNISAHIELACWLLEQGSDKAAEQLLLEKLQQQPNIRLFKALLEQRKQGSKAAAEVLDSVTELVANYLNKKVLYSCRNCGFKTRQHYWLCPSCQQWETVEPISGIDGR